jgi:hypothetical protein
MNSCVVSCVATHAPNASSADFPFNGAVSQLLEVPSHARGRRFKSYTAHQDRDGVPKNPVLSLVLENSL